MIRDMVTKPTGRDPHRPTVPFRKRDDRYLQTFIRAHGTNPEMTQRGVAGALAAAMHGKFDGFRQHPRDGLVMQFFYDDRRHKGKEGDESRNKTAFSPWTDDLTRQGRRYRHLGEPLANSRDGVMPDDLQDRIWYQCVTTGWKYCFYSPTHLRAYSAAQACCILADELPFFERVMGPIINHRFGLGPEPKFSLPDFCPHAAA